MFIVLLYCSIILTLQETGAEVPPGQEPEQPGGSWEVQGDQQRQQDPAGWGEEEDIRSVRIRGAEDRRADRGGEFESIHGTPVTIC